MKMSFPPGLEPSSPKVSEFLPPGLDVSLPEKKKTPRVSVPVFIVREETTSEEEAFGNGPPGMEETTNVPPGQSTTNLPPGMMDSKLSDQTPPGMEKNASFVYVDPTRSSEETKENTDTVASFLVQRMEELSLIKQKHAEMTERLVAAKIRELDTSIREELRAATEAETRCRTFAASFEKWTAPAFIQRAQIFTATQEAEARLRGLEEGIRVQAAGMRKISRVARDEIEDVKGKITRLHRNTDAMARSLGKETKGEHNQSLKLSIYLSQRHLSEASKACDQANAERKSRDADVAEFKMEEISRLIHQSNVELELLRANIQRELGVLNSEVSREKFDDLLPEDPEYAKFLRDTETLRNERDEKRKRLESLETQLENMKNKRHALEREFRELKVAIKATAPSSRSNVDIAEQQMKQLESLERKRKELSRRFKDRVTTVASETRLAEEVKWRNRIEAARLRSATTRTSPENEVEEGKDLLEIASGVENTFQHEFEDRVSMLRREKEERQRLSSISRKRLDELEADLSRVEEARSKRHRERDELVNRRVRLKNLKATYRDLWRSGKIDSDRAETFFQRVQYISSFTPEMIAACRSRMTSMRRSIPLIRTCRVDHQHRVHVLELILHLREFVATYPERKNLSPSMTQALQELGLVLPDESESPETQRVQFASLRDTLISTYSHLTSELSDMDTKLLRDIKLLKDSTQGNYEFKYRGEIVADTIREDKKLLIKRPNFTRWERSMRSSMSSLRGFDE